MKLLPRLKPNYDFSDWRAAFNIFKPNPIVAFEERFAQKFDNQFGTMFQHGRSGIYALLKVWGLQDAEVICPAYTCVVVPDAVVLSGNIPVFVDCAKGQFNMDLDLLKERITNKTRVIIATHLFGYPMDVDKVNEIVKWAEKKYGHKIYVIQDVAHSFGAKWNDRLVTCYGDASIFGLNISKMINSIFGGMVTTNSNDLDQKLKKWREKQTKKKSCFKELKRGAYFFAVNVAFNSYVYGIVNWLERKGLLDRFVKYFKEGKIAFPNDWDQYPSKIEARIGLNQLRKYDDIVHQKIKNSKYWINQLREENIQFMADVSGATYSHCVGLVGNREEWLKKYRNNGIQLGIIIEYSIPYMAAYRKYSRGEYPVSLGYSKKSINFPNWSGVI